MRRDIDPGKARTYPGSVKRLCLAVVLAISGSCGDDDVEDDCPIAGDPELDVGVPDTVTFLDFAQLQAGGDIPLSSNGQTFLAVQLAVRARNFSTSARIGLEVTYAPAGEPVRVAVKDDSFEERLFCRTDGFLYLVPVVVSSQDLGDDLEIQDQPVTIELTVTDGEGRTTDATASGVLRRF